MLSIDFKIMETIKNKVQLIGIVGQDPTIMNLEDGQLLAQFSLGITESIVDDYGENKSKTNWFSIEAWGNEALKMDVYVGIGDEIAVEGKLTVHTLKTKDGERYSYIDITANHIDLVNINKNCKSI